MQEVKHPGTTFKIESSTDISLHKRLYVSFCPLFQHWLIFIQIEVYEILFHFKFCEFFHVNSSWVFFGNTICFSYYLDVISNCTCFLEHILLTIIKCTTKVLVEFSTLSVHVDIIHNFQFILFSCFENMFHWIEHQYYRKLIFAILLFFLLFLMNFFNFLIIIKILIIFLFIYICGFFFILFYRIFHLIFRALNFNFIFNASWGQGIPNVFCWGHL